jgi:hypothetical protein
MPDDTLNVEGSAKWVFAHGWWTIEGLTVVDQEKNEAIPGALEPLDFSELVDPRDVLLARNQRLTPRTWKFKTEVDAAAEVVDFDDLPDPQPMPLPVKSVPVDIAKTRSTRKAKGE